MKGRLLKNVSLSDYTSWRVGGPAEMLYIPSDLNDLTSFLQQIPEDEPLLWLGLGSNVLIRDSGVKGLVVVTQGALHTIDQLDTQIIRAEAGVACAKLARHTARLGLTGLEFMAGIPGTVGGALAMNAGCWGGETWQTVTHVETMNRKGERQLRPASDYQTGYRHVSGPKDEWFVAGHFKLESGEKTRSLAVIHELLEKRSASQPTGLPNCGSVFRNPTPEYAARLIEQCGLKGQQIGDAIVSEKHANFIINQGKATASDIETLIAKIIDNVFDRHGVRLMTEVCIIGK